MASQRPKAAIAHVRMGRGGSEACAMWGIQALKDDFDVTLLTAGVMGPCEIGRLNEFYGTSLRSEDFHVLTAPLLPGMKYHASAAALRGALFQRFCRKVAGKFDVLISAYNPCDFGVPAIHFIADFGWDHDLLRWLDRMPRKARRLIHRKNLLRRGYLGLCRRVSRPSGRNLYRGEDLFVMNSHWTAELMRLRHGVQHAPVIYPPVTTDFPRVPWEERKPGFVCLGRISHEKRIETIIEILGRLRHRGHELHLHVIGEIDDSPYGRLIRTLCRRHAGWVFAEGIKGGKAKAELLSRHRFGIHACPQEAFGIAIAEMVEAGCIPFVPSDGGQVEIVETPALCYHDVADAVRKIDAVLRSPPRQRELTAALAGRADRFSTARFVQEFREVVQRFVGSRTEGSGREAD